MSHRYWEFLALRGLNHGRIVGVRGAFRVGAGRRSAGWCRLGLVMLACSACGGENGEATVLTDVGARGGMMMSPASGAVAEAGATSGVGAAVNGSAAEMMTPGPGPSQTVAPVRDMGLDAGLPMGAAPATESPAGPAMDGGGAEPEGSGDATQSAGQSTGDADEPPRKGAATPSAATFRNPLNQMQGSDPWLLFHEGYYYLTTTSWARDITVRRSPTLSGLKDAEPMTVWQGDELSRCCNIWAPEFHLLDGPNGRRWYLYFTAGPPGSDTSRQRNFVLEGEGDTPLGPYHFQARVYDERNDTWAIDPSVVRIDERLYFLFSAWEGEFQNLFIAPMANPWTLSGSRVRISSAAYPFERSLANVNEAPEPLQHDGRTFVAYSASACWGPDYSLGLLELRGSDPLRGDAWHKYPEVAFARDDGAGVFGPGHNGFFLSPDGTEHWLVYHANDSAAGVCDTKRTTRVQPFTFDDDGLPDLGAPLPLSEDITVPSGE